jgi:hypothetical protein
MCSLFHVSCVRTYIYVLHTAVRACLCIVYASRETLPIADGSQTDTPCPAHMCKQLTTVAMAGCPSDQAITASYDAHFHRRRLYMAPRRMLLLCLWVPPSPPPHLLGSWVTFALKDDIMPGLKSTVQHTVVHDQRACACAPPLAIEHPYWVLAFLRQVHQIKSTNAQEVSRPHPRPLLGSRTRENPRTHHIWPPDPIVLPWVAWFGYVPAPHAGSVAFLGNPTCFNPRSSPPQPENRLATFILTGTATLSTTV